MKSTGLKLLPVDPDNSADLGFLYGVLERRLAEPHTNISHKTRPSWEDHASFVNGKPYYRHEIITLDDLYVGVLYVDRDGSVGIYVSPEHRRHGIAKWALQQVIDSHRETPLRANINPRNEVSIRLFESMGFKFRRSEDVQYVYERDNEQATVD